MFKSSFFGHVNDFYDIFLHVLHVIDKLGSISMNQAATIPFDLGTTSPRPLCMSEKYTPPHHALSQKIATLQNCVFTVPFLPFQIVHHIYVYP